MSKTTTGFTAATFFALLFALAIFLTVPRDSVAFPWLAGGTIGLVCSLVIVCFVAFSLELADSKNRPTPQYAGRAVVAGTVVTKNYDGSIPEPPRLGQGLFVNTTTNEAGYELVMVILYPSEAIAYLAGATSNEVSPDQWSEELVEFVNKQYERD